MQNTIHEIDWQGKAMVVTRSRAHAVLYKQAFDRILKEEYHNKTNALIAFSGAVQFDGEDHNYTEDNMNPKEVKDIKNAFDTAKYRILIVANKFQTGFDQPLLHTMYVDKPLGGVATVQTLSRLNRIAPNKKGTMVLDFVNEPEKIKADFQDYYQTTILDKGTDTQKLYNQKFAIEVHHVFSEDDVERFIELFIVQKVKANRISSMMLAIVRSGYLTLNEEEKISFRKQINHYIRSYAFLSQIITFLDTDLEKFYLFTKLLFKYLPYEQATLPLEVIEMVDMDKYALQELDKSRILLEKAEQTTLNNLQKDGHGNQPIKYDSLETILIEINEKFGYDFKDFHKVMQNVKDYLKKDEGLRNTMQAKDIGDVKKMKFEEVLKDAFLGNIDNFIEVMTKMDEDEAFSKYLTARLFEWFKAELEKDKK